MHKDYHGWLIEDVLHDLDTIVSDFRMNNKHELCEFITGNGVIKPALIQHLSDYGLEPRPKLGNPGVITVIIQ